MIDKELLEILACPKCKADVKLEGEKNHLHQSRVRFALSDPRRHSRHAD